MVKVRWQICRNGHPDILRPIPCPVMQAAAGIFFVIWIRTIQKHSAAAAASDYWNQVDLYIGGTEHAVGHLLYSRMWTKFLFDLDLIGFDEPYKKLVNQGMIQGSSRFVYRIEINGSNEMEALAKQKPIFISAGLRNNNHSSAAGIH